MFFRTTCDKSLATEPVLRCMVSKTGVACKHCVPTDGADVSGLAIRYRAVVIRSVTFFCYVRVLVGHMVCAVSRSCHFSDELSL